jgi:mono/diheme cytochrome c family protein
MTFLKTAALLLGLAALSAAQSPGGDAKKGKDIYVKYSCYSCHSFDGHGGAGARLVPMKLPLVAFIAYVRNPRQMPSYSSKVMPDADLADVWAYIRTLPDSPAVRDIPLLNQLSGQKP